MIDRNGNFSPTADEKAMGGGGQKSSLLTEASFLASAKDQMDETREINNGLSKVVSVLNTGTFSVRVANFKSGITTPILDYMTMERQEEKDIDTRRHKENALYLTDIRRTIDKTAAQNNATITGTVRETYYNITKSVVSALGTLIKPVFKTVGFALFGAGSKNRSVVEAIDEQTQFMRTGKIIDSSTIFSRFFRRGIVGSTIAGAAGAVGLGRGAAQSGENKRARGEELTLREKLVTTMGIQLGWFRNFDKLDTKRTFQPDNPEMKQVSILDRIRLGIESLLEHYNSVSEMFLNEIVEVQRLVQIQTRSIKASLNYTSGSIADQLVASNYEVINAYKETSRMSGSNMTFYTTRQNSILTDVKEEIQKSNSPIASAHEQRKLFIQNAQYEELQKANELAKAAIEERKEKSDGGGGLLGMAMSLGSLLFNSRTAAVLAGLGKKFVIAPVMGAIKAGGAWLMRNGFKLLLRAPFAKIFAIVGIAGLFTKYLARPMIDWFDETFKTDIGGSIDRFSEWIGSKFTGILDWVREKMSAVPIIGKFFEKDDGMPKVSESEKKLSDGENKGILGSVSDIASNALRNVTETGGKVVSWYGDQWSNMAKGAGSVLTGISSQLSDSLDMISEKASDLAQNGIDRIRGYDPTALESMRKQSLDTKQIAQDAFQSVVNPAMQSNMNITDDMTMAALESRDAMYEQINEMKTQRKEAEEQNRRMIEALGAIAGNTEQGVIASLMASKMNKSALKNQNAWGLANGF